MWFLILVCDINHIEFGFDIFLGVGVEFFGVLVFSDDDSRLLELSGVWVFDRVLVVAITHLVECSGFDVGGGEFIYEYKLRVLVYFLVDFWLVVLGVVVVVVEFFEECSFIFVGDCRVDLVVPSFVVGVVEFYDCVLSVGDVVMGLYGIDYKWWYYWIYFTVFDKGKIIFFEKFDNDYCCFWYNKLEVY